MSSFVGLEPDLDPEMLGGPSIAGEAPPAGGIIGALGAGAPLPRIGAP
jgi:hypothetical protein